MIFTTEYSSQFVWHENAYRRPILHVRHKLFELAEDEEEAEEQNESRNLHFPRNHHHHPPTSILIQQRSEDESKEKDESLAGSSKKGWDWDYLHSLTRNPMPVNVNADGRGMKSHFIPATIDVLLDLGMRSANNGRNGDGNANGNRNVNQYLTSVYKTDFSWKR